MLTIEEWSPLNGTATGDAYRTEREFDGLGRVVSERKHIRDDSGNGDPWTDGWQDVAFEYDAGGRLVRTTVEPGSASPGIANQVTKFEYDAQGRRTLRIMPGLPLDGNGDPVGRREITDYDLAGRVWKTTFAAEDETCGAAACVSLVSSYDDASRRTGLTIESAGVDPAHYAGTTSQSWSYDGLGRVLRSQDDNGSGEDVVVSYLYDSLGRVLQEGWRESPTWPVVSTYDRGGRRATLTYPGGAQARRLEYTWDELGRLDQIVDVHAAGPGDDETVVDLDYRGATRLVGVVHSDGSAWQAEQAGDWDQALRRTAGRVVGNGAPLFAEAMRYDANDLVTSVVWGHVVGPQHEAQQYGYL
ncbi:MAG: hypothetical protein KBD01_14235 [Acidobacteria bacterium]|nr:hypothetical protein [Acidobacteriota bacterium]